MSMHAGAFWMSSNTSGRSTVSELMDRASFTIEEFLDLEDLTTEARFFDSRVMDYLSSPATVEQLIRLVVTPPPPEPSAKTPTAKTRAPLSPPRYPYLASELFACGIESLNKTLFEQPELLGILFSILEREPPLQPQDVAYFRKVVSSLAQHHFEDLSGYLRMDPKGKQVLKNIMRHIGLHSVLEVLGLLTWDDAERVHPTEHIDWLVTERLIPQLTDCLHPSRENEPEVHPNASQALVDAAMRAPFDHNEIQKLFADPATVAPLFEDMVSGSYSSLQHSLSVVIALVRRHLKCHELSEEEEELKYNQRRGEGGAPEALPPSGYPPLPFQALLIKYLPDLLDLLKVDDTKLSLVVLDKPTAAFGPARLKIVELLLWALRTQDSLLEEHLIKTKAMTLLLDLFVKYEWNNMLHIRVANAIEAILDGTSVAAQSSLFEDSLLLEKLVGASDRNDQLMRMRKGTRAGFMGHVLQMSNAILEWHSEISQSVEEQGAAADPALKQLIKLVQRKLEIPTWKRYAETRLKVSNEATQIVVGGPTPTIDAQDHSDEMDAGHMQFADGDDLFNFDADGDQDQDGDFFDYFGPGQQDGSHGDSSSDSDSDDNPEVA